MAIRAAAVGTMMGAVEHPGNASLVGTSKQTLENLPFAAASPSVVEAMQVAPIKAVGPLGGIAGAATGVVAGLGGAVLGGAGGLVSGGLDGGVQGAQAGAIRGVTLGAEISLQRRIVK